MLTSLRAASAWLPRLSSPSSALCVARQSPRLLGWHADNVGAFPLSAEPRDAAAVASLAEALDGVARDAAPDLFEGRSLRYEVGNVISRDFAEPKVNDYLRTCRC